MLSAAGIVYRPLVCTANERLHPAVTQTLAYAATKAALPGSVSTDAKQLQRRWKHEVQLAILRHYAVRCAPRDSEKGWEWRRSRCPTLHLHFRDMHGDGNCKPLCEMEYQWLSKSGIIENLLRLRGEEVSRIKREFQSKDKTDAVRNDHFLIPRIGTIQAPHYPGVLDIGNMKVLLDKTKCLWIEYSTTNFAYLNCVAAYMANAAE